MRKLKTILLALALAVLLIPAAPGQVKAAGPALEFDKTPVLDDLLSATADGKPFDITSYPYDTDGTKQLQIINFVEYCYSFKVNLQGAYGLYIYVYNPQALDLDVNNYGNRIEMAIAYDADGQPTDYDKLSLRFCSKSAGEYANLFYKFKVIDSDGAILRRVNADLKRQQSAGSTVESCVRRYDVSGVELVERGAVNAVDYPVGSTFCFTGFVKSCGADPNAESTLTCTVEQLETITLSVKSTVFRTASSSVGANHQTDLNSVYFILDNRYLENYGRLQKIKAEWYEYKMQPAIVTTDKALADALTPYMGRDIGEHTEYLDYSLWHSLEIMSNDLGSRWYNYGWSYNIASQKGSLTQSTVNVLDPCPKLFYALYTDSPDFVCPGSTVADYIYRYSAAHDGEKLPVKNGISAELFVDNGRTADIGRTAGYNPNKELDNDDQTDWFNMPSYDSNHSAWQKFWDYGFKPPETGGDYGDIKPIEQLTPEHMAGSDAEISQRILVSQSALADKGTAGAEDYAPGLKTLVQNGAKRTEDYPAGYTVILFRYATTDYYAQALSYKKTGGKTIDGAVYLAQQTVFLDFDIIQLTFNRDGVYTVIPVVSSPIDVVNALTPPVNMPDDSGMPWWLWLIIGIVIFVVLLFALPWLIMKFPGFFLALLKGLWWFVKALGYTIASPVLLIIWIVKKAKGSA